LTEPHVVVVKKIESSAQKIFQNPVANLKSRKIHANLESKKYIMGCISRNGYFLIQTFCSNLLEEKITKTGYGYFLFTSATTQD
jgi:hypothetical protein